MEELMNQNADIYYKNKDAQVTTPNPTGATPLINSYFIQNQLGPNGTSGTMVDEIYTSLSSTKQVIMMKFSYQTKQIRLVNQHQFWPVLLKQSRKIQQIAN